MKPASVDSSPNCIATPNYAGFVPSLKHQYGLTYGNATRHILRTDPTIKSGVIQTEIEKRKDVARPSSHDVPEKWKGEGEDGAKWLWTTAKKYATGDDRFSFPPVPGYTGYIPRSQEHFGRPYVETTHASLSDFQNMLRTKATLPPRVQAIQDRAPQSSINRLSNSPYNPSASKKQPSQRNVPHGGGFAGGKITSSSPIDDMSPYRLPQNHPHKTFISGYTGFVPRLQNHFGEPYSDNVREALDEFTAPRPPHDPYRYIREQSTGMSVTSYSSPKNTVKVNLGKAKPIPGMIYPPP
ncbi:hypothetical protein DFS34DRAFT_574243 [Phlyctochytrium arcticum]|nr:hypothetical protein DFS34DRAFT_574243 [Phlyctochytrium arcticum]